MMKAVYSCEICRDEKAHTELRGLYFTSNTKFDIRDAKSTEGIHICFHCLCQLAEQAAPALARWKPDQERPV